MSIIHKINVNQNNEQISPLIFQLNTEGPDENNTENKYQLEEWANFIINISFYFPNLTILSYIRPVPMVKAFLLRFNSACQLKNFFHNLLFIRLTYHYRPSFDWKRQKKLDGRCKNTEDIHTGLKNRKESSKTLMMTFAWCFICYLFFGYTNDTVQEGDISKI